MTFGCVVAASVLLSVHGAIICQGESAAVRVNSPVLDTVERSLIIYASPWAGAGESVSVDIDGTCLFSTTNQSETACRWQPLTLGNHALTCTFGTTKLTKTMNVTVLDLCVQPTPNPPMAQDDNVSITPTSRNFGVNGGGNAIIVSGSSATWTAAVSDPWITLNATAGNVGYPVAYIVSTNMNVEQRTGYVYVSGWVHAVTQDGVGGSISSENVTVEHQGGNGTIAVTAADKMVWQARPNVDWLSVTPTSGVGEGSVTYQVAPYIDVATRQGTLTVAGNTFTVFQYGRRMKLSTYSETRDYGTYVIPITVSALATTQWSVTPNNSWISVVDAGNGQGGDLVRIATAENPSYKKRVGTVRIGTETFTVTQRGRPPEALSFSINPTNSTASMDGANGIIAVTATPDLPWKATSDANWLTVYAETATGLGNGNVVYSVSPNLTLLQRTGNITVTPEAASGMAAKTHKVTQPAAQSALSSNGYEFEAAGESCSVDVSVSSIVQWSISESLDWITVNGTTNRMGPGTVTLQAAANDTVCPRNGTVKIAGKNFVVSQKARSVELEYDTMLFGTDGGYESIAIHPDGNSSWTAVASDATWITIFQGDSGTGDGEIMYIVSPYVGNGTARTGWIAVGDKKVYITQRAYDLSIDPNGTNVVGSAGAGEIVVSASIGDVWTTIVTEPWITLVSGCDSGAGSGVVRFLYTENNTGKTRVGKIIISGEVYTLEQLARQMVFDVDVSTGMSTNITEIIGAEYGVLNKRGGGDLTLSAVNEFTGSITNGGGLIIADIGVGIPPSACLVFKSGVYAPLSATSLTVPLGTGPGKFDMTLDHLKIAALNAPLTINFGGNAEPIISGGHMNPNAKAFHFGWKNNNDEYPITILNPLVISSTLTLRSQRNAPVTLVGGVCAANGVKGMSLDMPDGWPSQFRFADAGSLNIPGNKWNPRGGGTTMFDGGRHEVGDVYGSCHNIVLTNGAHFVSQACYLGRDNANNLVNVYAYGSVISNASGNVRLGSTSNASGNWYMRGGELAFADVSGTSFIIGDSGQGAFYQVSGDVKLRNSAMYLGFNSAYSGLYKIDEGAFSTENTMNVGYYGTGTVVIVDGNVNVGSTFLLGRETAACGRMRMSGGIVSYNHNAMIGRYGCGYLLMTGGQLKQNTDMESSLGRFASGVGRLDIIGGEYKSCYSGTSYGRYIGWAGTGVVSVASSGLFSFSNTVHLGYAVTGYGEIDLYEGGVFETKTLSMGSGYQKIVADGGTFRVGGNGATVNFFNNAANLDESYVGLRGVTFDTRDNTATIGNFALDGRSPGAIRKVGSGTLILTGIPQTGGGIEVNEGTVALASGAVLGTAFTVPTAEDVGGNVYPSIPSKSLVAQNYLLHRWSFNHGSVIDSIAGNVATVHDDNAAEANIAFKNGGASLLRGRTKGVRYIDLGAGLFGDEDGEFTIELWARVPDWSASSKLLTIGNSETQEIFLNIPGGVCARGASNEPLLDAWGVSTVRGGTMCHFSIVIGKATDGKRDVRFRLKDATTGETLGENVCVNRTYSPILHQDIFAFGYSYHDEVDAKMDIDEVRIWKAALSDEQLTANVMRGPDNLPTLNMEGGSGPIMVASDAIFDLGGNTITYPGIAGAGAVRNGSITVETLNVTGAMRIDADVRVTGTIVFDKGASLVTTGTLNIAAATVKCVSPISLPSLVLASTEGGGRITGTPAVVDLGANSGYDLSISTSSIKVEKRMPEEVVDPMPEISSDSGVAGALAGAVDEIRLTAHLDSKAQYDLFRVWMDANGLEHQAVMDSPRAWFSYAIGANGLVEKKFQNADLTICSPSAAANGGISFEVDVKDVTIGTTATSENLATVFSVRGTDSLEANAFSSGNVAVEFGVSSDGRLLVTATPRQARGTFFFRVRMHADSDASAEGGTLGPVVDPVTAIFSITFDANGGVGGMTRAVLSGNSLGALPTVMRAGYTFDNWWTAKTGGSQVPASTVVTADKTYYAHWIKDEMPPDEATATYCVIDLSAGANAVNYPVTYLNEPPTGGFNTDEYKTNKLVLRRIESGTFIMGDDQSDETHRVTLTKPFYCGVFEVTQRQYELVTGERPSYFNNASYYATRPVERVSYNMIRGSSAGVEWPGSSAVDADSFVGKLRAKTGIVEFDLPTEAQWEFACRAGTTSNYNNGGSSEDDLRLLGRYAANGGSAGDGNQNCDPSGGSAKVGSYRPNAWGLYDMHGNVSEWCLDWYDNSLSYGLDPKGAPSGTHHVVRGGGWDFNAQSCRSASSQSSYPTGSASCDGFRLARTPKPVVSKSVIMHNMVQLWEGGPYWADTNIGADEPWEYGYYFWWGDTVGYKWQSSQWVASDNSVRGFSFIGDNCATWAHSLSYLQSMGCVGEDGNLLSGYDAAAAQWGDDWRIPKASEFDDLLTLCSWNWTTNNGVVGYAVTGKGLYSGNGIFLPAAGYGDGATTNQIANCGYYWGATADDAAATTPRVSFGATYRNTLSIGRRVGLSIRPVKSMSESPEAFAVTFDANGGAGTTAVSRQQGVALGALPEPMREGYTFVGWFTTVSDGTQVTASTVVTANATYYAHWTVKTYTVNFDANGGTWTTVVSRQHGEALGTLPEPTHEGYTFLGWFTTVSGGTQVTASTVVTAETTYYAHWAVKSYTVNFDANGGTGTRSVSCEYGAAIGPLPSAMREGYSFLGWFTAAGGGTQVTASTVVTADATYYAHWKVMMYCVVDLSTYIYDTSTKTRRYSVAHYTDPPTSGFNTDEYKTTKLVLRRIEAGTFIMGENQSNETHRVTLTKPFYCGVFEVTQKQYELVMGTNPSSCSFDCRPVEQVSYDDICGRQTASGASTVSFLDRLRSRTGLNFDLPTEAQWEYACRAGTTSIYYWGDTLDGNYVDIWSSHYYYPWTTPAASGVGAYLPNAWGLYDMAGNVSEWCLDWHGHQPTNMYMPSDESYGTDPVGPSSGRSRVVRGGCFYYGMDDSRGNTSYFRDSFWPDSGSSSIGFRVVRVLSN